MHTCIVCAVCYQAQFICMLVRDYNAVLSGVHQSYAGSVLANPSPGFMLGIHTFVHCIWVDIFLT